MEREELIDLIKDVVKQSKHYVKMARNGDFTMAKEINLALVYLMKPTLYNRSCLLLERFKRERHALLLKKMPLPIQYQGGDDWDKKIWAAMIPNTPYTVNSWTNTMDSKAEKKVEPSVNAEIIKEDKDSPEESSVIPKAKPYDPYHSDRSGDVLGDEDTTGYAYRLFKK